MRFGKITHIQGTYWPPADKSITHRALILAAMANGRSELYNVLESEGSFATLGCLAALGIEIAISEKKHKGRLLGCVHVNSAGYRAFTTPTQPLWCGNSGTTARLVAGMIAPANMDAVIYGSEALQRRPMGGIVTPLRKLGANIEAHEQKDGGLSLPISIKAATMSPTNIDRHYPSSQVKTSIIAAALQLDGLTTLPYYGNSRDHIERMLPLFGGEINLQGDKLIITGGKALKPAKISVPGDISAAAYMIASVYMYSGSKITVHDVGLNPTRRVFLDILKSWGADIEFTCDDSDVDMVGSITAVYSRLTGGVIDGKQAELALDELPLLAVMGLFTQEPVTIRSAAELRTKDSDRIESLAANMRLLGAKVDVHPDGLTVHPLENLEVDDNVILLSNGDQWMSMINALLAKRFGVIVLKEDLERVGLSYPGFMADFVALSQ
jgi:3-phosphoshikimate 1-carboxyvinyltransferase